MNKLEQLKSELDSLAPKKHKVWEEYLSMAEKDIPFEEAWNWYNNHHVIRRYNQIEQEIRSLEEPLYGDLPDYGKHMIMDKFVKGCEYHTFTDDDGSGYYATKDKITNIEIYPSDVVSGNYREDFDYVVWFNK